MKIWNFIDGLAQPARLVRLAKQLQVSVSIKVRALIVPELTLKHHLRLDYRKVDLTKVDNALTSCPLIPRDRSLKDSTRSLPQSRTNRQRLSYMKEKIGI